MNNSDKAGNASLSENELAHWLALNQTVGVGALTFQRLVDYFGNAHSVFSASTDELRSLGLNAKTLRSLQKPDWHDVEQQQTWAMQANNHIITSSSDAYPQLLRNITDPPPILFVSGSINILKDPQIAIVGSRKPSPGGKLNAMELSQELAHVGLIVTSGLAYGIDSLAHQGALNVDAKTIAVLGSGLDNIYPKRHRPLAQHILKNGALVSELPPTTAPLSHHFPRRNRIISGLSLATLVIEASEKSGSLITAKLALEQGRDVMAVPGSIKNPMASGCHQLIKEGAILVDMAEDVVNNLNGFLLPQPVCTDDTTRDKNTDSTLASQSALTPIQHKVLYSVDYAPTYIDNIVVQSGLTIAQVSSILLALELLGHVSSAPGGMYYRLTD